MPDIMEIDHFAVGGIEKGNMLSFKIERIIFQTLGISFRLSTDCRMAISFRFSPTRTRRAPAATG